MHRVSPNPADEAPEAFPERELEADILHKTPLDPREKSYSVEELAKMCNLKYEDGKVG